MPQYLAKVYVQLKPGILDPQGQAISHALHSLGFNTIENVQTGKLFELTISAESREQAESTTRQACDKLLANPVIEEYTFEISKKQESVTS